MIQKIIIAVVLVLIGASFSNTIRGVVTFLPAK